MRPLIPYFIQEKYLTDTHTGVIEGFTLFVDMSGFTRLTSALMQQGKEGAEKLSVILNDVFGPMVTCVYDRGGRIPYFAGDAFTAVFTGKIDNEHALEILQTAQCLLDLLKKTQLQIPVFHIGVKIGVGVGNVHWGIVGNDQKAFYFNGPAIEDCIASQKQAQEGEIIFSQKFQEVLGLHSCYQSKNESQFYQVIDKIEAATNHFEPSHPEAVLTEVAEKFLPIPVLKFNQQGEFRTVISVFISFDGCDNHEEFDEFVSIVLDGINEYSGYFKEVDFGDKGGVMLGFFGAPVSYENNVERALEFLLSLDGKLQSLQQRTDLKYRAGVTSGIAYAGIVGGPERCQYAAVGTNVNLAARLMTYGDWGEIMVDSEVGKDRNFHFNYRGDIHYKGFDKPIATYELVGRRMIVNQGYKGVMIAREKELQQLITVANRSMTTGAEVAYVFGEAGTGKSRLTYELRTSINKKWHICRSDQILQKPFNPFVFFLKNYFRQTAENGSDTNRINFEQTFDKLIRELKKIDTLQSDRIQNELYRTRPFLGALIGLNEANNIWKSLNAKGRYQNTLVALSNLLIAEALIQPMVLELEDAHWFDDNSQEFVREFISRISDLPIFVLITSRYDDEGQKKYLIPQTVLDQYKIKYHEVKLPSFNVNEMVDFAEKRLNGKIDKDLKNLLKRTTNGNPFYVEQMLEYFLESDLLTQKDGQWTIEDKDIQISGSINAILTSRIDRLSNLVKETVKTAAVIGREFEVPILREVLTKQSAYLDPVIKDKEILSEQIKSAEKGQIWQAMNELRYIFRHSLLREAVYEMQLRGRVRELHLHIAQAIEKLYANNLEGKYVDLAFHYEQAEESGKTVFYLEKAADSSKDLYQNIQAIRFYDKLLLLLRKEKNKARLPSVFIKKGEVEQLIGEWDQAEESYLKALEGLRKERDRENIGIANNCLGQLHLLRGNYELANQYLEAAAAFFEVVNNQIGIGKVYGDLGNLYFRQGNYENAKSHFIRSIRLSERHSDGKVDAQIVANLGLTYMNLGKYEEGIEWQKLHLELCREADDKQGMGTLYVNLGIVYFESGDYENASECFENGLEICNELGNKHLVSIAIGSLGRVYERKGNYEKAMELFEEDLEITEELGDKQGKAIANGLIGELKGIQGDFEGALTHMEQNLQLSREIGYQKGVAKALNILGDLNFAKEDYEKAVEYYQQAIHITKKIKQPLVLTSSLIEKGLSEIHLHRVSAATQSLKEAAQFIDQLGNPDVTYQFKILESHIEAKSDNLLAAETILRSLLLEELDVQKQAEVHYELYRLIGNEVSHIKALDLYEFLYKETPQYLFGKRIGELKG